MTTEIENKTENITILINRKPHKAPKHVRKGREIKEIGGGPLNYLLVLNVGKPDPGAGGDDLIIADDELVELKSGMHFRIVNPATFG